MTGVDDLSSMNERFLSFISSLKGRSILTVSQKANLSVMDPKRIKDDAEALINSALKSHQNIDQKQEMLLNAFVCLYSSSSLLSLLSSIKRHQSLVMSLIQCKLYENALPHLSLIQKVLTCILYNQKFTVDNSFDSDLLTGVPFIDQKSFEISKIVIAFHFLSLQALLKMLACNLKLIQQGEHYLFDAKFLEALPRILLSSGNLTSWIEHHSRIHNDSTEKHISNLLTITKGLSQIFEKITSLQLESQRAQLKLKIAEYEYRKTSQLIVDIELIEMNQMTQPFYDDLKKYVPHKELIVTLKLDSTKNFKESDVLSLLSHIGNKDESLQAFKEVLTRSSFNFVNDELFIVEYISQSTTLSNGMLTELNTRVLQHFSSNISSLCKLTKTHFLLFDKLYLHVKTLLLDKEHPEVIRLNIEYLFNIHSKFKDEKRMKALSDIAFKLAEIHKSRKADCIIKAIDYEFLAFSINSCDTNLESLESIITKACSFKIDKNYSSSLFRRIYRFLQMIQLRVHESEDIVRLGFQKILGSLVETVNERPEFSEEIFGGTSKLTESFKVVLAFNMLQFIQFHKEKGEQVETHLVNMLQIDDDLLRVKFAYYCYTLDGLEEYPKFQPIANPKGKALLYTSGIEILSNEQVEWNLQTINKSVFALEAYIKTCKEVCNVELDIVRTIAEYLVYNEFNRTLVLFILNYLHSRSLENDTDELKLKLDLLMMQSAANIKLGNEGNVELILKESANLLGILNKNSSISSKDVLNWKINQVKYYLTINDLLNAFEKLKSTMAFTLSKPEFSLVKSNIPLSTKLSNLLAVAQLNLVASELHQQNQDWVSSYQCARIGLKLTLSLMRSIKADILGSNYRSLKWQSTTVSCRLLYLIIQNLLELGVTRDLLYFMTELNKLNESSIFPLVNAFNTFFLCDVYVLIGHIEHSKQHFKKGSDIASLTIDDNVLLMKLCSEVLQTGLSADRLNSLLNDQESIGNEIQRHNNCQAMLHVESIIGLNRYTLSITKRVTKPLAFKCELSKLLEMKQKINILIDEIKAKPLFSDLDNSVLVTYSGTVPIRHEGISSQLLQLSEIKKELLEFADNGKRYSAIIFKDITQQILLIDLIMSVFSGITDTFDLYSLTDFSRYLLHQNDSVLKEIQYNSVYPVLDSQIANEFILEDTRHSLPSLLPSNWTVITLDLTADGESLVVSKFNNNLKMPLYFKLPLRRMADHSGVGNVLSFNDAIEELNSIIEASNASIKPGATSMIKTKEERKTWWRLRFSLDMRIKELVENIENTWFGAFKGLFNSVTANDLSAEISNLIGEFVGVRHFKMEKELISILSQVSYSESRQIAEDAIFFILDSLVYAGYEVSYDEIDLDKFKQELQNLFEGHQQYHTLNEHIILVPGTKCCKIPWESLPSLQNKSISRMPSIKKLMEALGSRMDLRIDSRGLYLINPGGDLTKTEVRFKETFQKLSNWDGIIGTKPSNPDSFLKCMLEKQIFVYIGHGGCEEYIKPSVLFKLTTDGRTLPPSLLIGCSSGSLETYGILDPHGNVSNWLNCGCPMIIANLWDVTDKDIDQFTLSVFRVSSLLEDHKDDAVDFSNSLRDSRQACNLKYLNGSAPVLYGLPLHL